MSNGFGAARRLRADTRTLLAESEAAFAQKFAQIKGVVKKVKINSALQTHQRAWKKEAMQLAKQRKQLESDIASTLVALMGDQKKAPSNPPSDLLDASGVGSTFAAQLRDLDSARVELHRQTQVSAREMQTDIRRAKAMLQAERQQKAQEKFQTRIQPTQYKTATPASATNTTTTRHAKKKSVGFNVPASTPESNANGSAPSSVHSSPLGDFLASLTNRLTIDESMLAAEENNLVRQLLLIQESLQQFEQPIDIETLEQEEEQEEAPLLESPAGDEIESPDVPAATHTTEAATDDGDADQLSPTTGATAADDTLTFLTAASLSPRTRRTFRSTMGTTVGLTAAAPFPVDPPPMDPSTIDLNDAELTRLTNDRCERWREYSEESDSIQNRFDDLLRQLRQQHQDDSAIPRRAVESADAKTHWSAKHQLRFQTIMSSYKTQGFKRAQVVDRLRIEFGSELKIDQLALSERVDLYTMQRAYKVQRSALQGACIAERAAFLTRCTALLQEYDRARVVDVAHARAVSDQQAMQATLHDHLDHARSEKVVRDQLKAAEQAAIDAAEAEDAAKKAARDAAMRQKQATLLQLYHAHVKAEEEAQIAAQRREQERIADEQRISIEESRPRVERRQELLHAKRVAQSLRDEEAARAELEREQRLESIRQLVAPVVERDPNRLLQSTVASAADGDANNPLFAVHGYDMSSLLKDQRFRLQLALWNAGVSHTPYAKAAVMGAQTATAPRPDMNSTLFATTHA